MKYYIQNTPKIKLKHDANDRASIIVVLAVYLSPIVLFPFNIKNEDVIIFIECIYYVLSLFVAEYVIFKERKKNFRCFKKRWKQYVRLFVNSVLHCITLQIVLCIITSKISKGVSENQASVSKMPLVVLLIMALGYAPVVEEVVFRYVLRRLIKKDVLYIVISGLVFGLVHVLSSIGMHSVLDVFAYSLPHFGVGLYLAYVYASTNSIETCIIIHRGLNLFASIPLILLSIIL